MGAWMEATVFLFPTIPISYQTDKLFKSYRRKTPSHHFLVVLSSSVWARWWFIASYLVTRLKSHPFHIKTESIIVLGVCLRSLTITDVLNKMCWAFNACNLGFQKDKNRFTHVFAKQTDKTLEKTIVWATSTVYYPVMSKNLQFESCRRR